MEVSHNNRTLLVLLTIGLMWQTGSFSSVTVAELDWGNKEHIRAVDPPFDYIIGTDVVSFLRWQLEFGASNSLSYLLIC